MAGTTAVEARCVVVVVIQLHTWAVFIIPLFLIVPGEQQPLLVNWVGWLSVKMCISVSYTHLTLPTKVNV